jgi:hypothetical protein
MMRASLIVLTLLLAGAIAQAGVTQYTDRPTFESLGTILENWTFSDFDPNNWNYPPEPLTTHGVTYSTGGGQLMVAGMNMIGTDRNGILNNYWTPLLGSIDVGPQYNMFGWDMTNLWSSYGVGVRVDTNLGSYNFTVTTPPPPAWVFTGYIADAGEYFIGFELTGASGASAPTMTSVTLGLLVTPTETTTWSAVKALY